LYKLRLLLPCYFTFEGLFMPRLSASVCIFANLI
jgi:hypothetical protein